MTGYHSSLPWPLYPRGESLGIYTPKRHDDRTAIRKYFAGESLKVTSQLKSGLESRINDFFRDENQELLEHWKKSPKWNSFKYMVALVDADKLSGDPEDFGAIKGVNLGFKMRTNEGFEFILWDKIGIDHEYRGNGYLRDILSASRANDLYITRRDYPNKKTALPAALKTTKPRADARYSRYSDYRIPLIWASGRTTVVHFFGFKRPITQEPIPEYSSRMHDVANYLAAMEPDFKDLA